MAAAGIVALMLSLSGCNIPLTSHDLAPTPTGQALPINGGTGTAESDQSTPTPNASALASAAAKAGQPKPNLKCQTLTEGEKTNIESKATVVYGSAILGKTAKVYLADDIWVMAAQVKYASYPGPNALDPTISRTNQKTITATWLLVRLGPGHAYSVEVVKNFVVGGIDYVYGPVVRQKALECLG